MVLDSVYMMELNIKGNLLIIYPMGQAINKEMIMFLQALFMKDKRLKG